MGIEARLASQRLAAGQYGVISRAQALAVGLSPATIRRRVALEEWTVWLPGTYLTGSARPSWRQALMAAALWAGTQAVVSHRAAAALFGLDGVKAGTVELTTTLSRRIRSDLVTLHRTCRLPACDRTRIGPLPVTEMSRTLLDLGAVCDRDVVEAALETALRRGQTSIPKLRWRLAEIGGSGARGAGVLSAVIASRQPSTAPAESTLALRLERVLKEGGLPQPVREHEIWDRGRFVARVDCAYPETRLAIEADGWESHSGKASWQHDLRRRNALTALGWQVLNVTWQALSERPEEVLEQVRRVLGGFFCPEARRSAQSRAKESEPGTR
ncbi:MAG TPA: DUF559 domain-containing protein [Actinomycetota bacterium]|nr:DUF559 domain-containing protein [Actinomycetota bacterium]